MAELNIQLTLDDSRRLTGKNLLWDKPGAIIDAFVSGISKQEVVDLWSSHARRLLIALNWQNESSCYRIFEDGISFAISAPMDALYAACEINEAAWELTCADLLADKTTLNFQLIVTRIEGLINEEINPELINLMALAKQHNAFCLLDDDEFSLGYGASAETWPVAQLPLVEEIDWQKYQSIPLALVTGTNGKSTTVRIMSHIVKESGKCCGVTSTDFIRVGDDILDYGDYSGPGGARMLLRHASTEVAVLEVARGGILRRGLPIDQVDAALITNIAEDHLGQYGINSVEALAQVKAVVAKALGAGNLVLNADDQYLVALAPTLAVNKCWFSLDEMNPILAQHREESGAVCFVRDGLIVFVDTNAQEFNIVAVNDIPMTLNGAAKHNVQNALGAVSLAKSLGFDQPAISSGLKNFSSSIDDNPGRGNQFELNGAKVIMDFAHNVHSMNAMASTTANMPAKKKYLMIGIPGDRSDQEIIDMTQSALTMRPDILVITELAGYLRGRELGEIPRLISKVASDFGMSQENIVVAVDPVEGSTYVVDHLQESDLALLMVLAQRDKVVELLKQRSVTY